MRIALLSLLVACSSPSRPVAPPATPNPELSPALEPLAWWLGDWEGPHGSEHWIAAAGAIYGIALGKDGGFEAMIVDDAGGPGKPDGVLRFIAMPGGASAVEFRKHELAATAVTFANPAHDYPTTITYRRDGARLAAVAAGGDRSDRFGFAAATRERAIELEIADRALADATVARSPIASGRRGDLGFTVGKATKPGDRLTYVTIWRRHADGSWKVLFDVGRVVNE